MPPARPRPDDSRSETSSVLTTQKDRAIIGGAITKSKKNGTNATTDATSTFKTAAVNGALAVHNATANGTGAADTETPSIDWNTMPISTLHAYRAANRINTPSAYTRPHAELIYNSSDIARSAPSQVHARRKALQLQAHRKKLAQANTTNGVSKPSKKKVKDKDVLSDNSSRDGRRKQVNGNNLQPLNNGDTIAQSIEPLSPTIESASASSDTAPSSLLNSTNPEATIIGRQSPTSLANTVRKHFNAQPLNEAEVIARFTYVVRQQGYGNATLGSTHSNSNNATATSGSTLPRTAAPIRVEGSEGDGSGSIMGSMGRAVRANDSGGGGAFRMRFQPQL